jgi:single-strand DNA-binding protein
MARSLNKVQLIGNMTRDPELRYTPAGNAVCTFSLATNRNWTTDSGEKREEVDFHRIVAWNKLGELCSQFLVKGRKVYVEGRLSTRNWTGQDGQQKTKTEVVIDDMILLDNKGQGGVQHVAEEPPLPAEDAPAKPRKTAVKKEEESVENNKEEDVAPDDIPF